MLHGVKVLDLTRVLAGPLAATTLGDLGAQVIKVERPGAGDDTRAWGPPFDPRGEAAYYLSVNRNKIGIALDLANDNDTQLLRSLIEEADVVLDNYKRGTLERRGLVPEDFLTQLPKLIWCTITGFGPDSSRPGYDFVVQAEAGWMSITGEPDGAPMKVGVALADVLAGKDAAIAVLGALARRNSDGPDANPEQRRLFISLSHSATAALVNVAQNVLVSGKEARRWGNGHPNLVPYQAFRASDRYFVIAVGNDAQWRACCAALSLDELASDSALETNSGRLEHRTRIVQSMSALVVQRPARDWIEKLDARGVPCGVVRPVREALADVEASPLTGVAPSVPGSVRLPPPTLDEHGALIRVHRWNAFAHLAHLAHLAR